MTLMKRPEAIAALGKVNFNDGEIARIMSVIGDGVEPATAAMATAASTSATSASGPRGTSPANTLAETLNQVGSVALPVQEDSGFKFGPASEKEMVGVEPKLIEVVRLALRYSTQDFLVHDGIRTHKEQAAHVRNGTSRTMASKHLDGLAVDLVPYMNGRATWDWDGCYRIAAAMDRAATELGVADRITWGGAWDRRLSDFGGDAKAYAVEVAEYRNRHRGSDFIDGPHFEWRK